MKIVYWGKSIRKITSIQPGVNDVDIAVLGLNQAQVELPWFSEENWEKAQKTFSFALVKPRGRVYYYTTKESPTMKRFTSSVFSFEEMIRNGCLYVDKTEYIWERIEPPIGTYFLVNFDKDTGQIDKWTVENV